ncbi:translation initiation factor eIF2B subunit beta [Plodia interpunctella]|uniref:translation initiation factor eIF2B subunit beta n=1 Tax=Plodia interpunctella TaxID=58824 RepID=UPI0023677702|nr:translation initiation factor eIF-2B subunit beta [Plodia interpunctella]
MSPSEGQSKELDSKYDEVVVKFVSDVRSGKLQGSYNIAVATISLLEQMIVECQNATAFELCSTVRAAGRCLTRALPQELVAANMVRRILRAIRDEHSAHANQSGESLGESLQRLVLAAPARRATLGGEFTDLRGPLRDHIAELLAELETSKSSISAQAREHVHADELLLTYGASSLVERFLRNAAQRRYRLILAEGTDVAQSHAMAGRLAACGVPVTVVASAAITAVMPRINKVVVGVRCALAGGAALGQVGLHALTAAAKYYSVPVIVLAPLYKLSPLHQHHSSWLTSPHTALTYGASAACQAHVVAPLYDFVPPDHITLFITNLGGSSPSYIYRLLSELYDSNDHQL